MINFIILFPWLDNSPSPQIWVHLFSETIWRSRIHNNTSENLKAFSISTFFLIRVVYFISITVLLQSVTYACWSQCNLKATDRNSLNRLIYDDQILWWTYVFFSCPVNVQLGGRYNKNYIFLDPCLF